MDLRDVLSSKTDKITLKDAVGRVSAEVKSVSPPGYPILLYGELIKEEHLKYFQASDQIKVVSDSIKLSD